jgi:aspartate racemase
MKTIGILGGLGPESTTAYYSYITRKYYELFGDYGYPEILIHSLTFSEFIDAGYKCAAKITSAIEGLAGAGADFVIAACNSIHVVYDQVCQDIPIPWVSIMEAVAEEVRKKGPRTVGLLGTVFTMQNDFYQKTFEKYQLKVLVPDEDSQKEVNEVIYKELITGDVQEDSKQSVLRIMEDLQRAGVEGVILGCTELPFLIRQEETQVAIFDSTAIHAQKALDMALS